MVPGCMGVGPWEIVLLAETEGVSREVRARSCSQTPGARCVTLALPWASLRLGFPIRQRGTGVLTAVGCCQLQNDLVYAGSGSAPWALAVIGTSGEGRQVHAASCPRLKASLRKAGNGYIPKSHGLPTFSA